MGRHTEEPDALVVFLPRLFLTNATFFRKKNSPSVCRATFLQFWAGFYFFWLSRRAFFRVLEFKGVLPLESFSLADWLVNPLPCISIPP